MLSDVLSPKPYNMTNGHMRPHQNVARAAALRRNVKSQLSMVAMPVFVLGAFLLMTGSAFSAEQVGKSFRIKNTVNGSLGDRRLAPSDPVFATENISAAVQSHGELLLNDNSRVLVGENSSISLDDFVTGSRGFSKGSIKVAKGAFRFITGNSKKGAFEIKTPLSTIGVRGTIFDVYVSSSGQTRVLLFRGEVEVCSTAGVCITTRNPCDIIEVKSASDVEQLPYLRSPLSSRTSENQDYELTELQGRFNALWRAPTAVCETRAALDPSGGNKRRIQPPKRDPGFDGKDNTPPDIQSRGDDFGSGF